MYSKEVVNYFIQNIVLSNNSTRHHNVLQDKISTLFSRKSETNASEFLENCVEIDPGWWWKFYEQNNSMNIVITIS